jgi:hypothetical protein
MGPLVREQQNQRQQQKEIRKYFYVFTLMKTSLLVTVHKAPNRGLEAEGTKWF